MADNPCITITRPCSYFFFTYIIIVFIAKVVIGLNEQCCIEDIVHLYQLHRILTKNIINFSQNVVQVLA